MNKFVFTVHSEEELKTWACQLAQDLKAGMVVLLHGELGAGKTTLTKGLAQGLGINQVIKSPTYTLIREYTTGKWPLYHMDMYRLEDIGGDGLGLVDYFEGNGITVVEWSEFIQEDLPNEHLDIYLERQFGSETTRHVSVVATGEKYQYVLNHLKV